MLWDNARIRLTCPEAYPVHKEIIEWNVRYSKDRIPEQAVGVDPVTAKLMRWVLHSWQRVDFFNRFLFGTIAPRIQLDYIPALCCAAHLLLLPEKPPEKLEDHVRAGIAMQRLWLTAAKLGLFLQPEMTPVIFRWYQRAEKRFSAVDKIDQAASVLASDFERVALAKPSDAFAFFCRVGNANAPTSRSIRKDLQALMI